MQGKKSTIFGQTFDITDEKLASMQTGAREQNTPAMEALAAAMPEMVADLRNEMREDSLCVDGRVIGAGTMHMCLIRPLVELLRVQNARHRRILFA